jgi:calcineurin-like phosphoesterase family protein
VFVPAADATVRAAAPEATSGSGSQLRVDGSPVVRSYVRFNLAPMSPPVGRATLYLYANSHSIVGFDVYTAGSWTSPKLTYTTAPALGQLAGTSGPFNSHTWTSIDVTSAVRSVLAGTGSRSITFALVGRNGTAINLAGRRDFTRPPRLVVRRPAATTSTNAAGSRALESLASQPLVIPTAPSRKWPILLGTPRIGGMLTISRRNTPKVRYAYRWFRCDWTGTTCNRITGQVKRTYRLVNGDLGLTLRARVSYRLRGKTHVIQTRASAIVTTQSDPIIGAAGDIACDPSASNFNGGQGKGSNCHMKVVSDLLLAQPLTAVLPLGDDQYECGRMDAFMASYAPTWGRLKPITHPAIGNHEYGSSCHLSDAQPYFQYFGAEAGKGFKGWYSYDIGSWHLIALNSECGYGKGENAVGGCGQGSPQETWLRADLAAHKNLCTLAYWHEPRFSSGQHGNNQAMATIWNDLTAAHADVVLSGHNHDYERFDPIGTTPGRPPTPGSTTNGKPDYQNPVLDPNGIREFIVGTGGKNHYGFSHGPLAGEVIRNSSTYGVLLLTLHPTSYEWKFAPEPGKSFTDAGSGSCH